MLLRRTGLAILSAMMAVSVFGQVGAGRLVAQADFDGDGRMETVALRPERAHALVVTRGGKRIAEDVPRRWKPWKLAAADVTGDGRPEIIVGVHKGTRYMPRPHNCLFVYRLRGDAIEPVWLGSSLSRPFSDFVYAPPVSGKSWALYALEATPRGGRTVAEYGWNGFGYTLVRRAGDWRAARLISASEKCVCLKADGRAVRLPRNRAGSGESRWRKE